jgi:hypothetical protein
MPVAGVHLHPAGADLEPAGDDDGLEAGPGLTLVVPHEAEAPAPVGADGTGSFLHDGEG